jgi:hypothetical protein
LKPPRCLKSRPGARSHFGSDIGTIPAGANCPHSVPSESVPRCSRACAADFRRNQRCHRVLSPRRSETILCPEDADPRVTEKSRRTIVAECCSGSNRPSLLVTNAPEGRGMEPDTASSCAKQSGCRDVVTSPLGDPPALPGRQWRFDRSWSMSFASGF